MSVLNPNAVKEKVVEAPVEKKEPKRDYSERPKTRDDMLNKHRKEINNIFNDIDFERFLFTGEANAIVPVIGEKLQLKMNTCEFKDILSVRKKVSSGELDDLEGQIEMLAITVSEIIVSGTVRMMPEEIYKRVKMLNQMEPNTVNKMILKMDQFNAAIQMLVDDEGPMKMIEAVKK